MKRGREEGVVLIEGRGGGVREGREGGVSEGRGGGVSEGRGVVLVREEGWC